MSVVFADTFYLVALLNRDDQYHARCVEAARQLKARLVTTAWVLIELADAMAKTNNRNLVAPYIRTLEKYPRLKIIPFAEALFQRGLQLYDERPDKYWTLTDCISFVVMADEKITEALTGDKHFEQAGFRALLA